MGIGDDQGRRHEHILSDQRMFASGVAKGEFKDKKFKNPLQCMIKSLVIEGTDSNASH
jgi:hypothetical protein